MALTLRGEVPQFRRCCFCLPLRRGLIGWGYARLVLDILVILYLVLLMTIISHFYVLRNPLSFIAVFSFFIIDVAFTVLHIFAGHKKNVKLLRISYIYSICWVVLVSAFGIFGASVDINRIYSTWQYYISHKFLLLELGMNCAIIFIITFVQVYVILLTRSEAIKLQHQSLEMQFVNNAAEAEARCVSVEQGCSENGDTLLQYTEDKEDSNGKITNNGHDSSEQQKSMQNGNKSDISE